MSTDFEKVRETAMQIRQTRALGSEGIARRDIQRLKPSWWLKYDKEARIAGPKVMRT